MFYEINVTLQNKHFFATADRSIRDMVTLRQVLPVLLKKFPEKQGFSVTVTHRMECGKSVDIQEVLDSIKKGTH